MKNNFLVIEDSGIGIKEPSKVFNRFYKETSRGMGIGLHVVKKLCMDLNIDIKVESKLKKGTKFSLNLEKVMFN
jgi:signal transduction histidine kinase